MSRRDAPAEGPSTRCADEEEMVCCFERNPEVSSCELDAIKYDEAMLA